MLPIITLILFSFPGAYAYFTGRRFLGKEKTKAFAQDYFRYQQQSGMAFWLCFILSAMIISFTVRSSPSLNTIWGNFWWLFYMVYFLAAYSVFITGIAAIQSVVRQEHVPLTRRLGFNVAQFYLILWPYVFLALAAFGKMQNNYIWSIVISVLYAATYIFYFQMWKVLMYAQPLVDSNMGAELKRISEAAIADPIPVLIFPAAGLKFANAFFVGNFGTKKGVFISQFAYDNMNTDEVRAIYAHEIGHAQKNQLLRRSIALILPFLLIVIFNLFFSGSHVIFKLIGLVAALLIMKLLIPSQKFEKEADLFAVRAIGDVQTVISSIEKIHELGILPERFAPGDEKRLSHPSLVRRKNYMLEAAGQGKPEIVGTTEFAGTDPETGIMFAPDEFLIKQKDGKSMVFKYDQVTSMYPQQQKEHVELAILFTNMKKRLKLAADYDRVAIVVDNVSGKFSSKPYIDCGRFNRAYYIVVAINMLFGLIFSFFIGPALLVLSIIGLVKRRKAMYFSFFIANLMYFIYPYIVQHRSSDWMIVHTGLIFIVIAAICLVDYLIYRRFDEKEEGRGLISFGFSVFTSLVALSAIILLLVNRALFNDPHSVYGIYSMLFYNSVVLGTGALISHRITDVKRYFLLIINALMFFGYILLNYLT